jgi:immunity protein, SdpI family
MTRFYWVVAGALTVLVFGVTLALYPRLPDQIPTHWNIRGEVDAFGAKSWAAFLVPGLMLALLGLFALLPWLSPKRFEVDNFRSTYLFIMLVLVGMAAYIQGVILYAGLWGPVDVGRALVAGLCLALALLGNVLGKVQRNFYIGVRTPWTLADHRVWTDTHRLAAWTFTAGGVVGVLLALLGGLVAAFVAIMAAVFLPVIYSLIHYKQLERSGKLE